MGDCSASGLGERLKEAIEKSRPYAASPRLLSLTKGGESWCIHAEDYFSLPSSSSSSSSSSSASLSSFQEQWDLHPTAKKSLGKDNFRGGEVEKYENRFSCSWGRLYNYGANNHRTIEGEVRPLAHNPVAVRLVGEVIALRLLIETPHKQAENRRRSHGACPGLRLQWEQRRW